jgi:CysZ protein
MLAGNRFSPKVSAGEASLTFPGILIDLWEGIKIGMVGVVASIFALAVNFLPVVGQIAAFLIYVYYSTLMFIDFPSSRYRWNLRQKIGWVVSHKEASFRLGLLPALISLVPILNIFLLALLFPLFTVHTTLNYLTIERR